MGHITLPRRRRAPLRQQPPPSPPPAPAPDPGSGSAGAPPPERRVMVGPLGLMALAVGALLWLIGSRYTLSGWVQAVNIVLTVVGLPARVPEPTGWWLLLALPLGMLYSLAEIYIVISWPRSLGQLPAWAVAVLILVLIHGSDVGSTALGYWALPPDAWAVHRWLVATPVALGAWSIFLTYVPERAMIWGWRWARQW